MVASGFKIVPAVAQAHTRADGLGGGPGTDTLEYGDDSGSPARTAGVTVDLDDAADDGAPGEGDTAGADIENLVGGAGGDTLIGNAAPNAIAGAEGADRIEVRGGGSDTVSCGTGQDSGLADASDAVASDCEAIALPVEMPPD